MTGVEVIVAALVAGGVAGGKDVAAQAVLDAYTGLREALRRRLGDRLHTEQVLAAEQADPGVWQTVLGPDLIESGADRDEQILAAARRLLAVTDPAGSSAGRYQVDARAAKGVQVGDHNIQHNTFS